MAEGLAQGAKEKPYVFAVLCGVFAVVIAALLLAWGGESPEMVLIGLEGEHDGPHSGARLAACLDCHVPFVGTPGSRCLGPGCHGELATGTPPRDGPAMPVRFHVALRDRECSMCHEEHVEAGTRVRTSSTAFRHEIIPDDALNACSRCHSGNGVRAHPITDAVPCGSCHQTSNWWLTELDHNKVAQLACDICHQPPSGQTHATVAGTCHECHVTTSWQPRPPPPPETP